MAPDLEATIARTRVTGGAGAPVVQQMRSRGYQMEMFQESLNRNIIVAMDTGSGKTHIAVLRIRKQLEKGDGKLCWLLVPSIPLGQQQYEVLCTALPPVNIQFLCGSDNVDKWGDQWIWDRVLQLKEQTSTVVISTHQILLDALTHGFVTIDKIGLLIYDEAHHCVGNHPAHRIMKDFYHPNFQRHEIPAILGLTASPIVKAKPNQLKVIESNLNAISRSPILNREELLQYVHHPVLKSVIYHPGPSLDSILSNADWSMPVFSSFRQAYRGMDIMEDPHIIQLLSFEPPDLKKIQEAIEGKRTRSHHQMRKIMAKAKYIRTEYGVWATEWYIKNVVQRSLEAAEVATESLVLLVDWSDEEKLYLKDTLERIDLLREIGTIEGHVTDKVDKLLEALLEEYHGDEGGKEFSGLVFVQQRVGVTILDEIIRTHPRTKGIFNTGTLVGAANNSANAGKLIYELSSPTEQKRTIGNFRSGRKNLVISTSVVEEGLDIPACNLVVCFSPPPNVKSFIQRRGRARRIRSSYILMIEGGSDMNGKIENMKELEREMIVEYLDETRKLKEKLDREEAEEDEYGIISDGVNRKFLVRSTDALLTLDSAVPHLQHFCGTLPHTPYVDLRPLFTVDLIPPEDELYDSTKPLYRAEVLLPNAMPPSVRRAKSKMAWEKQAWAKRDAAFEAYIALHRLEDPLINDNLLPLWHKKLEENASVARPKRRATASVHKMIDPWEHMDWKEDTIIYATPITLRMSDSRDPVEISILMPVECPSIDKILIYWTETETGEVIVGKSKCLGTDPELITKAKIMTCELLHTVFGARMQQGITEFPYLFVWGDEYDFNGGRTFAALESYTTCNQGDDIGIIREISQGYVQFIFRRWRTDVPLSDPDIIGRYGERSINPEQPVIEAVRLSNRRDFLHEFLNQTAPEITVFLLPEYCTVDKVPWRYSQFALFLPGVINRIGVSLVAFNLQQTLLASTGIKSTSNILTALSTPSARQPTDYQRFEFLGDSVLKFLTSITLLDEHPSWHEGNLTTQKARLISNFNLSKVAQEKGLAKWVITEAFTGLKWRPRYITGEFHELPTTERVISTKVLADVVEALIGAAYAEGGYEMAIKCIQAFGLDKFLAWKPLRVRTGSLVAKAASTPPTNIQYLRDLERLIEYKFNHQPLLVEAITHPSCESPYPSYQRLEFLGDALLDMVVLDELFSNPKELQPTAMHSLKSSVVNGNLLAFLSLGYSMDVESPKVEQLRGSTAEFQVVTEVRKVNFWEFVDLTHPEMSKARRQCLQRYECGLRDKTQASLDTGRFYPWAELAPLEADTDGKNKLFADIVEAIIGAVFVDSGGNFESVRVLAEKFGVLKILRRLIKDDVNVTHPVNRLAETAARMHNETPLYIEMPGNEEYVNSVWLLGEELGTARSACRMEAKARAAEISLDILEKRAQEQVEG